jgi:DNA-binding GntR family transcriptional regulator
MRLPPERELCLELRISRVTLRKALNKLVEDRVLSPSHGRGWYVTGTVSSTSTPSTKDWPSSLESFGETAARMGLVATSTVLRAAASPATIDDAELFSIAPGAPLFHLDRVRLLDGVPIAFESTRVPLYLVPGLAEVDFATASLYRTLADAEVDLLRADATIEAVEADDEDSAHLGLEVGKPLLIMRQLALDARERPVFSSEIRYAGDRYRLRTFFARRGRAPQPGG